MAPFKRHISWCPVNIINQQPSPQKLAASIVLLHSRVHPLPAHLISTPTLAGDECFITCCWGRKKPPQSPCVAFRLVKSTYVPFSFFFFSGFHIFYPLSVLAFVRAQHAPQNERPGLSRQSHIFYNVKATIPGSVSIPGQVTFFLFFFCLSSINQPAELHEREQANKGEGKGDFQ